MRREKLEELKSLIEEVKFVSMKKVEKNDKSFISSIPYEVT